jgi:AraC-like DNA-binding protein
MWFNRLDYPVLLPSDENPNPHREDFVFEDPEGNFVLKGLIEHRIEHCTITYSCEQPEQPANLVMSENRPCLVLYFNIDDHLQYNITGFAPGTLRRNQYNMVYVPSLRCSYFMPPGKYRSLSFQFTPNYLHQFEDIFPPLKLFMHHVAKGIPCSLSARHLHTLPEMHKILWDILTNMLTGDTREEFLRGKILTLLLLCLQHSNTTNQNPRNLSLRQSEIEKLHKAHEYILDHVNNSFTIGLIATQVDMDPIKLARGFKTLFGIPLYSFVIEERLKKALELLRTTEQTMQEIAHGIGYKKLANFSEAFKDRYGYPPTQVRKMKLTDADLQDSRHRKRTI